MWKVAEMVAELRRFGLWSGNLLESSRFYICFVYYKQLFNAGFECNDKIIICRVCSRPEMGSSAHEFESNVSLSLRMKCCMTKKTCLDESYRDWHP